MAHRRREGSQRRSAGSNRRRQKVNRYQQTQKGPGSQLRSPGLFACLTCWLLLYGLLRCLLSRGLLCCCFLSCQGNTSRNWFFTACSALVAGRLFRGDLTAALSTGL